MVFRFSAAFVILLFLTSCAPSSQKTASQPPSPPTPASDKTVVVETYRAWVLAQADDLLVKTAAFNDAVQAGNREKAKALYAEARRPYERIEPIAEALGDLDPRIDARENDVKPDQWQGFHKIEKLLWSPETLKEAAPVSKTLLEDVKLLRAKVETAEISVPKLVTGAVELLNEVSTSKITGEEDRYSHTDLWDFQANVDSAAKIWELLSPATTTADASLAAEIDKGLAALDTLLATHKKGEGFQLYTDLKSEQVKALSASVDALAEPLSKLGRLFRRSRV